MKGSPVECIRLYHHMAASDKIATYCFRTQARQTNIGHRQLFSLDTFQNVIQSSFFNVLSPNAFLFPCFDDTKLGTLWSLCRYFFVRTSIKKNLLQ